MASKVQICNMALSHLGVGKEISDIDTERSQEAIACRTFYDTTRKAVLEEFAWPFAKRSVVLGLVEEDPNDEWAYSYRYPTDAVKIRKIMNSLRNPAASQRDKFVISSDSSGVLIYSDTEDAEAEYTYNEENTGIFPADFTLALSYRLAMYLAPRLTAGDPFKLGPAAGQHYQMHINKAQVSSLNEETPDLEPESEFIRVRD